MLMVVRVVTAAAGGLVHFAEGAAGLFQTILLHGAARRLLWVMLPAFCAGAAGVGPACAATVVVTGPVVVSVRGALAAAAALVGLVGMAEGLLRRARLKDEP